jgi:hypothetical protein
MKSMKEIAEQDVQMLTESEIYDELIGKLQEAKENGTPVNEGILTGLLGGVVGATVGPTVMKAICNALGIDLKGPLGNLFTSRLILGAVGAKVGW